MPTFRDASTTQAISRWDLGSQRVEGEPNARLGAERPVRSARDEGDDVRDEEFRGDVHDRGHDASTIEVGNERPTDGQDPFDRMQAVPPFVVEAR